MVCSYQGRVLPICLQGMSHISLVILIFTIAWMKNFQLIHFIFYVVWDGIKLHKEASCKYIEENPFGLITTKFVWGAIQNATKKSIKSIQRKEFERLLAIVNLTNGLSSWVRSINSRRFFFITFYASRELLIFYILQFVEHFGVNLYHAMSMDKLQLIAATLVEHVFKARWLKWWNLTEMACEPVHFLVRGVPQKN